LEKITWTSVNIDKRMVEAIRRIITKVYSYKSVADYVQDAVRRKGYEFNDSTEPASAHTENSIPGRTAA